MPRIPILKLASLVDIPPPRLATYSPALSLTGLRLGIDNLRHDVRLSPAFCSTAGSLIRNLVAKYGNIEGVLTAEALAPSQNRGAFARFVPASGKKKSNELKPLLLELHKSALNRAKSEGNIAVDLLARAAVIKFFRSELNAQFASLLERCRATLKGYEGVRHQKALEYRETVSAFQIAKKNILRQASQNLFRVLREIEKETLSSMRRSFFGETAAAEYQIFLNQLVFLEENRDSYLAAEYYVLIGGFDNDPDSLGNIRALAREFLRTVSPEAESADDNALDGWLSAPENALELVGSGDVTALGPRHRLQVWTELLDRENLLDLAIAAYEVVALLPEFTPLLDPQQLKYSLVSRKERDRVEQLLEEHGKLSIKSLIAAAGRVAQVSGKDRSKTAARFLRDFLRYYRDVRRLETLNRAMEQINLVSSERLCDLSRLNGTLYDFMLAEEMKSETDKPVVRHVILKADVRDSSRLTRSLLERDMNPASYFSLNIYEPVNKLLAKYGATKVFVEGDAIILALLERQGDPALAVSRTCVLAREMMGIVGGYNHLLQRAGLPGLELGIGISYQDSTPMYLLDGDHRIMISDALNESDRLSGCDKRMRTAMGRMQVPFNIYEFRAESTDSEPVRYNVGGVRISPAAYGRLQQEISLEKHPLQFPRLWGTEAAEFFSGLVPLGADIFRRIVVRASRIPVIEAKDFSFKGWTDLPICEVCTNPAVYAEVEKSARVGSNGGAS